MLKPGAHGLVWALPRTSHWTATAIEDAGFNVKDVVVHIFGNGFPKSTAIDKALSRAKHADTDLVLRVTAWIRARRDELGLTNKILNQVAGAHGASHWTALPGGQPNIPTKERWDRLETLLGPAPDWMGPLILPAHDSGERKNPEENEDWIGWGTALKPASEHWILIQKPLTQHNIAANVSKYGVGGINIDACRIQVKNRIPSTSNLKFKGDGSLWDNSERSKISIYNQHPLGRHPANLIITKSNDENCPAKVLDGQSDRGATVSQFFKNFRPEFPYAYSQKPNRRERGEGNNHPTVKPLRLMRYFCKMLTPPGGIVLDPFMGSGTTGVAALVENFQFIGVEKDPNHYKTALGRLNGVKNG